MFVTAGGWKAFISSLRMIARHSEKLRSNHCDGSVTSVATDILNKREKSLRTFRGQMWNVIYLMNSMAAKKLCKLDAFAERIFCKELVRSGVL